MNRRTVLRNTSLALGPLLAGCVLDGFVAERDEISVSECVTVYTSHRSDVRLGPDATWPMHQYDARNSNYNPDASVPGTVIPYWQYSACQVIEASVTVAGGSVYPGRASIDGRDGSLRYGNWNSSFQRSAVVGDTRYVSEKALDAYDATNGRHRWTFDTGEGIPGVSAPIVRDGTVYITWDLKDPTLYAISATTGEEQWQFTPDHECNVPPATDGERVYVVDRQGVIYGLDGATGGEVWRHRTESFHNGSPPTVANDTVYVGVRTGVFAFESADGAVR